MPVSGLNATNTYAFDASLLGVLTSASQSGALTNRWQATAQDAFKRPQNETSTQGKQTVRANGAALGAAAVDAKLNGNAASVNFNATGTDGRWYADVDLPVGTNKLAATAHHPSGAFNPSVTNTFTVLGQQTA